MLLQGPDGAVEPHLHQGHCAGAAHAKSHPVQKMEQEAMNVSTLCTTHRSEGRRMCILIAGAFVKPGFLAVYLRLSDRQQQAAGIGIAS